MDIMDTQYYVYELIDPRNDEVFYIGKGNGDRMYRHRSQAFQQRASKHNPHKSARIRQIINEGYDLKYNKIKCSDEHDAYKKEKELIKKYGKRCDGTGCLTNLTEGGEGYTGGHIPVCQYDLFGNFIKQHRSAKEAAQAVGGKEYGTAITNVCRGGRRGEVSAFGCLWSYVGHTPKQYSKIRPVYQWSTEGKLIARYVSVSAAAAALSCDPTNIPNAIKKQYMSQGYAWSYTDEFPGIPAHKKRKRVVHLNSGREFNTVSEAAAAFGHNTGTVSKCCRGERNNICGNKFKYV